VNIVLRQVHLRFIQNDPVQLSATGYIGVSSANDGNLLGSLERCILY
jgi:hypothetical protein